jgi:hypothetical protein
MTGVIDMSIRELAIEDESVLPTPRAESPCTGKVGKSNPE